MGRRKTCLKISGSEHADIDRHIRMTRDLRTRERLNVLVQASSGIHTLEALARACGRLVQGQGAEQARERAVDRADHDDSQAPVRDSDRTGPE